MREEKEVTVSFKQGDTNVPDILGLPQAELGRKAVKTEVRRENMSIPSSCTTIASQGKRPKSKIHEHLCESIYAINNKGDIRERYLIILRTEKTTKIKNEFL